MSGTNLTLNGKRLVMLVEDLYEDLELWYPTLRLREAGAEVVIAGPNPPPAEYKSKHGYPCTPDCAVNDVNVEEFDGVIIPGGYAPDRLRRYDSVTRLVRLFAESGKLVAFICHGGWVPISAGVLEGINVTGFVAIKDDLVNAGAEFQDKSVVIDGHFVSSRMPSDLPDFCRAIIAVLTTAAEQPVADYAMAESGGSKG